MNNQPSRFLALDVFRGLTVCFMIIVNTPGDKTTRFAPLMHAEWLGFTPTDLVFPSFLFAVGNALAFVSPRWANLLFSEVLQKVLKRSAIIFLLGFLMYWFPFFKWTDTGNLVVKSMSETRILGVLQRIALAYFAASMCVYFLPTKRLVGFSVMVLLTYWAILSLSGLNNDPFCVQGNAIYQLDYLLFGDNHLYHGQGVAFDPEGLLSTLPAIVNVIAGFLVGNFILKKGKTFEGLAMLLLVGFSLITLAQGWNWVFPISKKLWTSSFALYTIGLDCSILAAIIYLIDFKNITTGTHFFTVLGKNPLFIYLFSEYLAISLKFARVSQQQSYFQWIYDTVFKPIGGALGSLVFAIVFMLICWLVGWWLDKKRIYMKV